MAQMTLTELLGKIKTEHKDAYEGAKEGRAPNSAWETADLPLTHEYRLTVDSAEYKTSQSGREQFVITYEVVEPAEYAGKKFQDYQSPNPTNTVGTEMLAKFFGAFQLELDDNFGSDFGAFIKQTEGRTVVAALRRWGEQMDRTGIRWVNPDKGQNLNQNVKPAKASGTRTPTQPDIQIPKPATAPVVTPPPAAAAPQPSTPPPSGGIKLPPGLQGG